MANIITGGTYSLPMQTIVFNANDVIQICKSNPRRVALGFYSTSTTMAIYPNASGVILSQMKPGLSTNSGMWFLADESGPLTQIEWYGYDPNSGSITIMQVVRES